MMKKNSDKSTPKREQIKEWERAAYRAVPKFLMEIARRYFRLEVEGLEHIPRRGAGIITPNHSGFSGFDSMLLANEIHRANGRLARVMTHQFWFLTKFTSVPAEKVGFVEATTEIGLNQLRRNNLIILFPEGEQGNFKPTRNRYHLQEFKRGFIRMALEQQCPILPVLIIGAEETHINLAKLGLPKFLGGAILPLPLNLIPLPAKWTIKFLPPIHLPYNAEARNDRDLVREIADEVRESMQKSLAEEIRKRESVF
jgi:1-acyl-sn-glycerol-3-phosphate acyltransferase